VVKQSAYKEVARVLEQHNPEQDFEEDGEIVEEEQKVCSLYLYLDVKPEDQEENFEVLQPSVEADAEIVEEEQKVYLYLDVKPEDQEANFEVLQPSVEADADIDVH
jgi:translation elongation factor EF-1beta